MPKVVEATGRLLMLGFEPPTFRLEMNHLSTRLSCHILPAAHCSHEPLEVEAQVSEDGSAGQEGAAHAGEKMPVRPIGWDVSLRHVIGLLDHLGVNLRKK